MSTPWMSFTGLYGCNDAAVPRGASIVTQWWSVSSTGSPPHQAGLPRPVDRQYANRRASGRIPAHRGSSAPFHTPTAAALASDFNDPTTFASSVSLVEPAVACDNVLRFTQVERPAAAAAVTLARAAGGGRE